MEDALYRRDPERLTTLARRFGWLVVGLFLFFGAAYLLKGSGLSASSPLRLSDVRLVPESPFAQGALMAEVKKFGGLPDVLPASLSPNFPPLAEALARHPWIAEVEEIRQIAPDRVEISVRWRTPLVEFEQGERRFFLSQDRVVLPFSAGVKSRPLRVAGLKLPPNLVGGERLDPPELPAAFAVEAALRREWKDWKLTHIEIRQDPFQPTLRLHAAGRSVIIWRSLGQTGQEASDEDKKLRLRRYLQEFGGFEKPNGPYLLDVRPKNGLSRMNLK